MGKSLDFTGEVIKEEVMELLDNVDFTTAVCELPMSLIKSDVQKLLVDTYYLESMSKTAIDARRELQLAFDDLFRGKCLERIINAVSTLKSELYN